MSDETTCAAGLGCDVDGAPNALLVVKLSNGDPSYWLGEGAERRIRADYERIASMRARYRAIRAEGPPVTDEQWESQQERLYDVETVYTETAGPIEIADVEWAAVYVHDHLCARHSDERSANDG